VVKQRKRGDLQSLLNFWAESRLPSGGYDPLLYDEGKILVLASLEFREDILPVEQSRLVSAALSRFKGKTVSEVRFLKTLGRLTKELAAQPLRPYVWVTKLSARLRSDEESTQYGGSKIRLRKTLPRRLKRHRDSLLEQFRLGDHEPSPYCWATVSVRARTPEAACDIAADQFDELRGIWNLIINRRTFQRLISSGLQPVNKLVLGPVRTIHNPSGSSAMQGAKFDDNAKILSRLFDWSREGGDLRATERKVRGYLPRIAFKADLLTAFRRYARALDGTDFQASYLKLWAILELLTGIAPARYDQLVKRTAFVWDDTRHASLFLESLRSQRNMAVHRDQVTEDIEKTVYILKRYVETILHVVLVHGRHYEDLRGFGQFLNLPPDPADLQARIVLHKRALKFRPRTGD
jgi:hypothetical protein